MKVTVCGSGKFRDLIHAICQDLTREGLTVLKPPLHDMTFTESLSPEQVLLAWKGATFAHLQRIAVGDVCLFVNPRGYMGASSTLELGAAVAMRKLIIACQHDTEPAREGMFHIVLEAETRQEVVDRFVKSVSIRSV